MKPFWEKKFWVRKWMCLVPMMSLPAQADNSSIRTTWIGGIGILQPQERTLNPENRFFLLPEKHFVTEIRPNVTWEHEKWKVFAKPRIRGEAKVTKTGDEKEETLKWRGYWGELYGSWNASDQLQLSYGLQNFQWGPAELMSPSNQIVHENAQQRDFVSEPISKMLFRASWSPNTDWNSMLIAEVDKNPEEVPFRFQEQFESKMVLKNEWSWGAGENHVGFVWGAREHQPYWLGEYFEVAVPAIDGLSLYADAHHQKGSRAWYPLRNEFGLVVFEQTKENEKKMYSTLVGGIRYAWERGTTMRLESLYHEAGLSKQEMSLANDALLEDAPLPQKALLGDNLSKIHLSGLEMRGQNYVFISITEPRFWDFKDVMVYGRALISLQDQSWLAYASSEVAVSDADVLQVGAQYSPPQDGLKEIQATSVSSVFLGYKRSW